MADDDAADADHSLRETMWVGLERVFTSQPTSARNEGMMEGGVPGYLQKRRYRAALDVTLAQT